MKIVRHGELGIAFTLAAAACSGSPSRGVDRRVERPVEAPVKAYCTAAVMGVGDVDTERAYLPRVVNCENGAADFEALKAQAIAARSYLYFKMETAGSIADGEEDQVYSCGREPEPAHYAAVEATSGLVVRYRGTQIAAFYVAGAEQPGPSCVGGTVDPTATERGVTYNRGLSGGDVVQTPLGFVHASNLRNRGCMSQNGSHCLSLSGRDAVDILRFYYGEDIAIARALGECVVGGEEHKKDLAGEQGPSGAMTGRGPAGRGSSPLGAWCLALIGAAFVGRRPALRPGARVSLRLTAG